MGMSYRFIIESEINFKLKAKMNIYIFKWISTLAIPIFTVLPYWVIALLFRDRVNHTQDFFTHDFPAHMTVG